MQTLMNWVRWLGILALGVGLAQADLKSSSAACAGDVSALRAALVDANLAGSTTIGLDSGCTYDFVDAPYTGAGPNALPVITTLTPIVINGNGATLALTNATSGRFFEVQTGASLILNNLTLKDGGSKGSASLAKGGAVLVDYNNSSDPLKFGFGALYLNNVIFNGNKADLGGAIYSDGEVDAIQSQVFASTSDGGAVYIHNGVLMLFGSSIYDNNTTSNSAAAGAGVVLTGLSVANIQSSSFVNNLSQGNYGGALSVLTSAVAVLGGDYFEGNQAALGGGAIYSTNSSALVVGNSTFFNNTAAMGAALYAGPGSNVNVANSTFTGNAAGQLNGGAIYNAAIITIKNSIVGDSSNGNDCAGAAFDATSIANLDVSGGCGSSFSQYPLDQLGLGALGFYGGPTKTIPLLRGPALTSGDPATCNTAPVNNMDQRGHSRGIDPSHLATSTCSIGAFEYELFTFFPIVVR